MNKIRPGHTGQVTVTRNNGRWVARARHRRLDGTTRDVRRWGATQADAREALQEAVRRANRAFNAHGLHEDSPLREVASEWLQRLDREDLSEQTERVYRSITTTWIINTQHPAARYPVSALTPNLLSDLLHHTGVHGGFGAAKTMRTVLRRVLRYAVKCDLVPVNPARDANFSRRAIERERADLGLARETKLDNRRAFTDAELQRVLDTAQQGKHAERRMYELVRVLARTGMRIGEACNLTRDDLTPRTRELHVRGTKTDSADRIIVIPDDLAHALARMEGPLCPAAKGGQRTVENSLHHMRELLDECGLEWASSHTFRRTVATKLDRAGYTAREIADHLGHAKPSMTLDVYMGRTSARDMSSAL